MILAVKVKHNTLWKALGREKAINYVEKIQAKGTKAFKYFVVADVKLIKKVQVF